MRNENKITPGYANVLGLAMGLLSPEQVPTVPEDCEHVRTQASSVKRYMSEAQREMAPRALAEIATRGQAHGRELGDLGPTPDACGHLAGELTRLSQTAARLRALADYVDNRRAVVEGMAITMLEDAASQAEPRLARGLLPSESYAEVRAYSAIHGEAVSKGRSRAKKARAKTKQVAAATPAATPANDTHAVAKTGTDPR